MIHCMTVALHSIHLPQHHINTVVKLIFEDNTVKIIIFRNSLIKTYSLSQEYTYSSKIPRKSRPLKMMLPLQRKEKGKLKK